MSLDFEQAVHRISRAHVEAEHPELLEEFDAVFQPLFEMALESPPAPAVDPEAHPDESLSFDPSLLDLSVVGLVITTVVQALQIALLRREQGRMVEQALRAAVVPEGATIEQQQAILAIASRIEQAVAAGVLSEPVRPVRARALQLLVTLRGPADRPVLEFRLDGEKGGRAYAQERFGERRLNRSPKEYFQKLYDELADMRTADEEQRRTSERRARNEGARLFEDLLSEELQAELRSLAPVGGALLVVSDDPWIPWELLKFPARSGEGESRFLVEVFDLARWLPGSAPPQTLPLRRMAVLCSNLSKVERAEEELAELMGRTEPGRRRVCEIPARFVTATDALASGRHDGWHFIGHGGRAAGGPERWEITFDDQPLRVNDLSDEVAAGFGGGRPFVFLNACHTGGTAPGLVATGGWPAAFSKIGAGAFLGPLWAVDSVCATELARLFYDRFLAGMPIAQALRRARLELRERFPGDSAWLAYSLYADPTATTPVRRPIPSGSATPAAQVIEPGRDRSWSDKREHKILAQRLSTAVGDEYESLVLRLLRPALGLWTEALVSRGGGLWVVEDVPPHAAAIAIFRFEAAGEALGPAEVLSVQRMLARVRDASIEAERLVLVHNRHGGSERFRNAVEAALEELVGSGTDRSTVLHAELWDYQRLLRSAFNGVLDRLLSEGRQQSLSLATVAELLGRSEAGEGLGEPLEEVPMRVSTLVANQFRLVGEEDVRQRVADPALEALAGEERSVTLLLGSFGFGKTTALARGLAEHESRVFYVPAATISEEVHGAKDLLERCVDLERLFEPVPEEDRSVYRLLARPVIEYVFKQRELDAVLVLDGLDESPFLSRPGGLQNLVNNLWDLKVPVVLSMRTEYWDEKRQDFEASFGDLPRHGERRMRRIRALKLQEWRKQEIALFLERCEATLSDPDARDRLRQLRSWLGGDRFEEVYGDIPHRPLFLRLIAETVAALGLPSDRVGRAALFVDAVRLKIRRDVALPLRVGGVGRPSILGRPMAIADSIDLAWRAMVAAAARMVGEVDGVLELLPDCSYEAVRDEVPDLREVDEPLALFLHSLLLLSRRRSGHGERRIRFAHRAFQEFFLAWHLVETGATDGARWPDSVRDWIDDLQAGGLVDSSF